MYQQKIKLTRDDVRPGTSAPSSTSQLACGIPVKRKHMQEEISKVPLKLWEWTFHVPPVLIVLKPITMKCIYDPIVD